ncbi:MAG: MBL fold metallo-hydrolase [Thermodesulfobacteriota bacterium]
MNKNHLIKLSDGVQRIEHCGLHVDLVHTSRGLVRVGSMPDIAKFLSLYGFREETVVVPDWEASMAGDNRTGEEFILWQAQVKGGICKDYTGTATNVAQQHRHLDETFNYYFDPRRIKIVRKRWLANWFAAKPAAPVFDNGPLKIECEDGNIIISDDGETLYDRRELPSSAAPDGEVEALLAKLPRDRASRDCLEITPIGTGNGFTGTVSNSVVRFEKYGLWIDPCGYPAQTLARHNIHWDDITHILITHNHEDHTQGFTACLKRAERTGRPLNVLTGKGIFALLRKQFSRLCPDFDRLVNFSELKPGTPRELGPINIECRKNQHFLPYGTLGFKISAGGKTFGYSGDTKFDESINEILGRPELTSQWFSSCDLVFHEIEFDNPMGVHSHWKQVQKLQGDIPGRVLAYHTPFLDNAPFPLAKEGQRYYLD